MAQRLMHYDADNLVIHPNSEDSDVIVEVTPDRAGWDFIHYQVRQLNAGASWDFATGEHELAIVPFRGTVSVESNRGTWEQVGNRDSVFTGLPYALYLPRQTDFTVTATDDTEFAVTWVPTDEDHPTQLVTPEMVSMEIRGGDNVTRQINDIIPPGFDCHRLVVVEVYTPSGNWSSYPPHKHDVHEEAPDGSILEADLEEVYSYKIDSPEGYAYQRIYTDPESPLHEAGYPIDALVLARDNDVVLVPEGYHPVVSAPGYTTYYLNVLAGSAQSLANSDDPTYAWVKESYTTVDERLPVYEA